PDGRFLAFSRVPENGQENGVFTIPAIGGAERKLIGLGDANILHMDWSPDGKLIAYSLRTAKDKPAAVFLLSVETLETRQLTFPSEGSRGDIFVAFSPDRKRLAFTRFAYDLTGVYVMSLAGGEPERLTFDEDYATGLSWDATGENLLYSSNYSGKQTL